MTPGPQAAHHQTAESPYLLPFLVNLNLLLYLTSPSSVSVKMEILEIHWALCARALELHLTWGLSSYILFHRKLVYPYVELKPVEDISLQLAMRGGAGEREWKNSKTTDLQKSQTLEAARDPKLSILVIPYIIIHSSYTRVGLFCC